MSNLSVDMHNIVSSEEAINIVEASVKTLMANPSLAHSLPPILLRGAPGDGEGYREASRHRLPRRPSR